MRQKLVISILFAIISLVVLSCSALWRVDNSANISFSLSKEALTAISQASDVRSIDSSIEAVLAKISLYKESGSLIDSENVILENDEAVTVEFAELPIIGENVYAKIEATIDGVQYEGISETKRMIIEGNTLHISSMNTVIKVFTLTFDANGGVVDTTNKTVTEDTSIGDLPTPIKEATTFLYWQIDGTPIISTTIYSYGEDKTAVAVWGNVEHYIISFNPNGGNFINPISVPHGATIEKPSDPTRENYSFAGWYTDESFTTAWDFDTDTVTDAIILYAKWDLNTYTLTFDANGGMVDTESKIVSAGMKIGELPIPSKEGATFSLWQIDGVSISSDSEYIYGADKEAKAIWDAVIYTVSFVTNGATELEVALAIYDSKIAKPTDPTRIGYTLQGWYTDEALTDEWVFDADTVRDDITLYAAWEANTNTRYTVKHNQQNIYDDNYTTVDTYNLTGTTGASVTPGRKTYTGFISPTAQTVVIAADGTTTVSYNYDRTVHTVTFEENGGSTVTDQLLRYGATITELDDSTRTGYILAGWYEASGFNVNAWDFASDTVTREITFYAKWNIKSLLAGTLVAIPDGTFDYQGTDGGKPDLQEEKTVSDFYLGETEVTQGQWLAVMGTWPGKDIIDGHSDYTDKSKQPNSMYGISDTHPAYYVSWYDAIVFCNKLSLRENLTPVYSVQVNGVEVDLTVITDAEIPNTDNSDWNNASVNESANGYRLPTQVEWEYAAGHGGFDNDGTPKVRNTFSGTSVYGTGEGEIGDYAWYDENAGNKTHVVGTAGSDTEISKSGNANALGLYDMSGNVTELCWDVYNDASTRTTLGGSWNGDTFYCKVAQRTGYWPTSRFYSLGFRLARSK